MGRKLGNRGFSITEVVVMGAIISVVLMASSQATIIFLKRMISIEKSMEASGEAQDLTMYVRRSSKNLTTARINMATTYMQVASDRPQPTGVSQPAAVVPALTINPDNWFLNGNSNPLYSQAQAAVSGNSYPIYIDSFNLEEHGLSTVSGGMRKVTRRLLVARCDRIENQVNLGEVTGKAAVTALYVLAAITRRPFLSFKSNGAAEINCCPPDSPRCGDGNFEDYFFKTYAISFDNSENVLNVEEFPKSNVDNPTVGAGFGLYFSDLRGANVAIQTFTINNRCKTMSSTPPAVCKSRTSLKNLMMESRTHPEIIKVETRSISTTISQEIVQTGVIAL